jgi:hypothetical protein
MPCQYVIKKEQQLVISQGWDRVTCAEILDHRRQIAKDSDFSPDFNQLVDGTAVTAIDISMVEAKTVAAQTIFSPKSRRAFVAKSPVILGLARIMETYSRIAKGREQVKVFHDRNEALQWLGIDVLK